MATIGDLVVRLSANTKAFENGIAKSQIALHHLTNTATKAANVVSDLESIKLGTGLQTGLIKSTESMNALQVATHEATTALTMMERGFDFAAASTALAATGMKAATSASAMMIAGIAGASSQMMTAMITTRALRQTLGTLSFALGLVADGLRVVLQPIQMLGSAFKALGSLSLWLAKLLLKPFTPLIYVLKLCARAAWMLISPFLGLGTSVLKLYVTFKAFQLQLRILRYIFGLLPPRVKAIVVGLMALGAASRVASAAFASLGVVGRMAAKAISLLTLPIRALISPVQTAKSTVAALNTTLVKTTAVATQAAAAVRGRFTAGIKSMAGSVVGSLRSLIAFGGNALPFAAVGAIKLAADAETLAMKMKVLTGSADAAAAVMSKLDAFAAETPFQKMEVGQATQTLMAFGSKAGTVFDELRMIGDIAAGTGTPLNEMADLYGKMRIQQTLYSEDINQLTGRGIPVIQALAKQLGVAEKNIKKMASEGKIGFPELQRALASMVGPAGIFNGFMLELSTTTSGKFSTFVDRVLLLGTAIGQELLPYANELLDWSSGMVQNVDFIGSSFASAITITKTWFTETRTFFEKIGVVVGVVVGSISSNWRGMLDDVKNYTGSFFDWMRENLTRMVENTIRAAQNAKNILSGNTTEVRDLIDEWGNTVQREVSTLKPMRPMVPFKPPELSNKTQNVLADVAEALKGFNKAPPAMAAKAIEGLDALQAGSRAGGIAPMTDKTSDTEKAKTELAAATKAGSQEAYSLLAQSFIKSKDPQVKATQEQTKALLKPLGQMAAAAVGGLGGLGGLILVEQI